MHESDAYWFAAEVDLACGPLVGSRSVRGVGVCAGFAWVDHALRYPLQIPGLSSSLSSLAR
jgi:hypothetical protein